MTQRKTEHMAEKESERYNKENGVLRMLDNAKGKESLLHLVIGGTSFRCVEITRLEVSGGIPRGTDIVKVEPKQVPPDFVSIDGTWIVKDEKGQPGSSVYRTRKGKFMFRLQELQGIALTEND